ncbi:hypothetical protein FF3_01635 [Fretibacterium fastidiosum]
MPCGGVDGECQTGASYEKHPSPSGSLPAAVRYRSRAVSPSPFGAAPHTLQGGLSFPSLNANWYEASRAVSSWGGRACAAQALRVFLFYARNSGAKSPSSCGKRPCRGHVTHASAAGSICQPVHIAVCGCSFKVKHASSGKGYKTFSCLLHDHPSRNYCITPASVCPPDSARRPVGRLRAKEVRGTSAARPDDAAYAIASAIAALRWLAVPKQGNGLPCGGVGGECQTGASYEKHPPAPSGQPPLQGGLSCPLDANWYERLERQSRRPTKRRTCLKKQTTLIS